MKVKDPPVVVKDQSGNFVAMCGEVIVIGRNRREAMELAMALEETVPVPAPKVRAAGAANGD